MNTHSLQFKQYANTPVMCFGLFSITIQNGLCFRNVKLFDPQNQSARTEFADRSRKNPQHKRPRRNHSATYLVYRKYIFDNGTTYLNSILVSFFSKFISDVLQTRHIETKTKINPLSIHR